VIAMKKEALRVGIEAKADLPTKHGNFSIIAFYNNKDSREHIAIVKGDVKGKNKVPVRLHSECLTGDVLRSLKCDCGEQLDKALEYVNKRGTGAVIYLRQEGRGIGLTNKIKAYHLQDLGLDTVEANQYLGFPDDMRDYDIAAEMIKKLGIKSIELLSNNPGKRKELEKHGVVIDSVTSVKVKPNKHNKGYLEVKKQKMNHSL